MLHPLFQQIRFNNKKIPLLRLAVMLGLLSHIETNLNNIKVGKLFADSKIKEPRFRKLMAQNFDLNSIDPLIEGNQLYRLLRGVFRLSDRKAPLIELLKSIQYWNNQSKQEWAYEYYINLKETKES